METATNEATSKPLGVESKLQRPSAPSVWQVEFTGTIVQLLAYMLCHTNKSPLCSRPRYLQEYGCH